MIRRSAASAAVSPASVEVPSGDRGGEVPVGRADHASQGAKQAARRRRFRIRIGHGCDPFQALPGRPGLGRSDQSATLRGADPCARRQRPCLTRRYPPLREPVLRSPRTLPAGASGSSAPAPPAETAEATTMAASETKRGVRQFIVRSLHRACAAGSIRERAGVPGKIAPGPGQRLRHAVKRDVELAPRPAPAPSDLATVDVSAVTVPPLWKRRAISSRFPTGSTAGRPAATRRSVNLIAPWRSPVGRSGKGSPRRYSSRRGRRSHCAAIPVPSVVGSSTAVSATFPSASRRQSSSRSAPSAITKRAPAGLSRTWPSLAARKRPNSAAVTVGAPAAAPARSPPAPSTPSPDERVRRRPGPGLRSVPSHSRSGAR